MLRHGVVTKNLRRSCMLAGMEELLPHVRQHFDGLIQKLDAFARQAVQVESWFKGECLALATNLQQIGVIDGFSREVKVAGGRIDFQITMRGRVHWIELKHWLVGKQGDTTYSCKGYFGDRDLGCRADAAKLQSMPAADGAWLWLFMTRNPGEGDWQAGIAKFNERFPELPIRAINPQWEKPEEYFLGVAEVLPPGVSGT